MEVHTSHLLFCSVTDTSSQDLGCLPCLVNKRWLHCLPMYLFSATTSVSISTSYIMFKLGLQWLPTYLFSPTARVATISQTSNSCGAKLYKVNCMVLATTRVMACISYTRNSSWAQLAFISQTSTSNNFCLCLHKVTYEVIPVPRVTYKVIPIPRVTYKVIPIPRVTYIVIPIRRVT